MLWNSPPESQASGPDCAVRHCGLASRTVLESKGPLRHAERRVPLLPPCRSAVRNNRDGRLRPEPDAMQFLCLTQDRNQMEVDKHS
jgi:hypothetical protein